MITVWRAIFVLLMIMFVDAVVVWPACFGSVVSALHSTVDMSFFAASASMPGALNRSGGRKKQVLWTTCPTSTKR
jgi:hypothetical protein